jgi:hypothetical protein
MKVSKFLVIGFCCLLSFGLLLTSCQKMERPQLKELVLDPEPPPYNPLKAFWAFENNTDDQGESKFTGTARNLSYVAGVTGQALKIGNDGYLLLKGEGDTARYPNGFLGVGIDTLKSLGSFTLAFWMNGTGPVTGGAQGLFSISNKNQFWGNLELFLENYDAPGDPSAAFLKVHMFNANAAGGVGEEWTEVKLPGVLNKWTHLAITYNEATSKLSIYKDGAVTDINEKVLGGGNYGKIKFNDVNGMVLGNFAFQTIPSLTNHGPETWAKAFNGALDQFRLYNKALSASEINSLFTTKQ